MPLVRATNSGAKTILAHFHYCCKGNQPFGEGFDWNATKIRKMARLDAEQSRFMAGYRDRVIAKGKLHFSLTVLNQYLQSLTHSGQRRHLAKSITATNTTLCIGTPASSLTRIGSRGILWNMHQLQSGLIDTLSSLLRRLCLDESDEALGKWRHAWIICHQRLQRQRMHYPRKCTIGYV